MSEFSLFAAAINRRFAELEAENERLRLRLDNVVREGRVTKVDPDKGTAEVDMNGLPSSELPISHRSGAIREWNPPSEGERVVVFNPSGEPGLGMVFPGGYSDQFAQPHAKAGESFKTVGDTSVLQTADKVVYKAGDTTITAHKDGSVVVKGASITLDGPVAMPKGFTAGDGEGVGGLINGPLNTTKDITSQTKVAAPVLQGALIG